MSTQPVFAHRYQKYCKPITDAAAAASKFWHENMAYAKGFDESVEHAAVLFLDSGRHLLASLTASGNKSSVDIPFADIFTQAARVNAKCLILFHSHPPGSSAVPSDADVNYTRELWLSARKASPPLGIELLDSVVLAGGSSCSLKKNGLWPIVAGQARPDLPDVERILRDYRKAHEPTAKDLPLGAANPPPMTNEALTVRRIVKTH